MALSNRAAFVAAIAIGITMSFAAAPVVALPSTLKVGSLTLTFCNSVYGGYCGSIDRPIDPTGNDAGTITVGFEYYPHTARAKSSLGTILPQEGGPGYATTGSRDFYLGVFAPLRDQRDVLLIDKRGTGLSSAINCPELQNLAPDFLRSVDACGKQLGATAYFYGTAFAVEDISAVLEDLEIDRVDFYGDSYGTFVGQVMAGLYPARLRSIILDSAYPVRAPDAWFATDWAKAWSGIELSCTRSPSCGALGGSATARVQNLLQFIRETPLSGTAPDGNGVAQATTLDTGTLFFTIDSAGYGPTIYRDLDAATRAWSDTGDALPLLRLVAEANTGGASDPLAFSEGLYVAVSCSDYPLLYDSAAARPLRNTQYLASLADAREDRPGLFAPFTIDEAIDSGTYITPLDTCLPWPKPPAGIVQGQPLPPSARFPGVPTLVLSGDLDSVTSPTDAAQTAMQFPDAIHLVIPNLPHVVAGTDEIGCASSIVLNFVTALAPGDTSCIRKVRPIRTVARFARSTADLEPLTAVAGNLATPAELRIAAAALESVGDVIARWYVNTSGAGSGLRGGQFSYASSNSGYDFVLINIRWTADLEVSGNVSWNTTTEIISSTVTLKSNGESIGQLRIKWTDSDTNASATVDGRVNGNAVRATRIAP
jgi:pimeloyl-ACP methyl ester carboxylesterase